MLWRLLFHIMRLLLLIPLPGHADDYDLTECNSDGHFDIVQNQQPVLTCTGLSRAQNISWSIRNSSSGKEMIIGNCGHCKQGCSECSRSPLVEGYNISRDFNGNTTLQFLNHALVIDMSIIKCSNLKNRFNATCTLVVVPEFEEHINEFSQSADDPDLSRRSLPNSPTPLSLANPSLDVQGAGSDGPENHVYAQVKKEKKDQHNKPETHDVKQRIKGGKIQKNADKGGAVYTECVSDTKDDNPVNNVYMNADESAPLPTDQDTQAAKKDSGNEDLHDPDLNPYHNTETTRHQGDYTNVQLELHDGEGVTKTVETDDEYRHLQLARPEQLEENPTYNHLEGV